MNFLLSRLIKNKVVIIIIKEVFDFFLLRKKTYVFSDVDGRHWRCVIDVVKADGVNFEREFRGSQSKHHLDLVKRTRVVREGFVHDCRDPQTGRRRV